MRKFLCIATATMTVVRSLSIFQSLSRRSFTHAFTIIKPLQYRRWSGRAPTGVAQGNMMTLLRMSSTSTNSGSAGSQLTRTEVRRLKVAELRHELEARGLDTKGLKKDLLDRLLDALPVTGTNKSLSSQPKSNPSSSVQRTQSTVKNKSSKSKGDFVISSDTLYVLRFHGQQHHNTATASCGIILYDSQTEKEVWSGSKFYSTGESAQAAEVKALLAALTALSDVGMKKLIVQGHAGGTTIQQLQGNFGVKSKSVKDMIGKIKVIMEKNFDDCEVWGITMDQISKVRSLSKKALSKKTSEGFDLLKLPQLGKTPHDENDTDEVNVEMSHNSSNDDDWEQKQVEIQSDNQNQRGEEDLSEIGGDEEEQHLVSLPTFSPNKTYVLRFDGGSRGNPGTAGAGMVLFDSESGLEVWAAFEYLGDTTNNVAEYTALLSGIQFASAMGITKLVAEGDSTLVVKQVTGEYRVKSDHLMKLNKSVKAIADSFDSFSIHYIPRAENFRADQLANVAMDEQATMGLEVFDYLTEEDSQGSQESIHSDSVRSLPQDVEETAPLQQVASDKCIFIPEALASDRILSKNRTYVLKFGGGMKGNKGMGSAAILMDDLSDEELWSGAYFYPNEDASQFIASYVGLIIGLRKAMSMGVTRLIVQGNMEFVIQQMSGKWKVKSEAIKPYQAQAKEICENYFDDVDFEIISDNDNTSVKTLCFEAIQSRQSRLPGFSE